MKIRSLRFVSVPFDNSYRNVFSAIQNDGKFVGSNFKTKIEEYIIDNYESVLVTPTSVKNVRRTELTTSFNCNLSPDIDVIKYNYIIIYYENSFTFWFINRFEELNVLSNHINYNFTLEYDVWNNHQDIVYNEPKSILVEQTHIQQLEKNLSEDGAYRQKSNLNVFPEQPVDFDYEQDEQNFGYKILWINIRTSKKLPFKYINTSGDTVIGTQSHWNNIDFTYKYSSGTIQDYYIPAIVYNGNFTNAINLHNVNFICQNANGGFAPDSSNIQVTEDVLNVRYTFHIPCKLTFELNESSGYLEVSVPRGRYGYVEYNDNVLFNCIGFHPFASGDDFLGYYAYDSNKAKDSNGSAIYADFDVSDNDLNIDELFTASHFIRNTPLAHRYPFRKQTLRIGQHSYDVIEKTYKDRYRVYVQPSCDGIRAFIYGGRGGNNFYTNELTPILAETNASLPTFVTQFDTYIRNNGSRLSAEFTEKLARNQIEDRKISADFGIATTRGFADIGLGFGNMILGLGSSLFGDVDGSASMFMSGLSQTVNAPINMAQSAIDYNYLKNLNALERQHAIASMKALGDDLSRAKDIQQTSSSGEVDTIYQDNVYMIIDKISDEYYTRRNIDSLKYINMYGFVVNDYMLLNNFPMRNFVFLKTVNAELSSKINLLIKKKIEDILNNGVRCWRITATNNYVKNMDTRVSNYFNTGAIE